MHHFLWSEEIFVIYNIILHYLSISEASSEEILKNYEQLLLYLLCSLYLFQTIVFHYYQVLNEKTIDLVPFLETHYSTL